MQTPDTLSKQDLEDILNGTTILGSGGGGSLAFGKTLVEYIPTLPHPVRLVDPIKGVGDDETMAIPAFVGAITAIPANVQTAALSAFNALNALKQAGTGRDFAYALPGETGSANILIPMVIAGQQGLPVVDAAGARRSIPSLTQCTWASHKLAIAPVVLSNGDQQISFDAPDAAAAEPVMRAILDGPNFGEGGGIAFWSMNGASMKGAAIAHCVSYARRLGQTLRAALAQQADPVEQVRAFLRGYILFRGTIAQSTEQAQGGFDFGTVVLESADRSEQLWIYNQNENLIAWNTRHSHPVAMAPDVICYLTAAGEVFSNGDLALAKGQEVVVIGAKSMPQLRDPFIERAFLKAFKQLGYAGPYVPIEQLQATQTR